MIRVKFQNGPDAPEIFVTEEFETKDEAKKRLPWFVENYGTVPEAVAWIEGDDKPRKAVKAEKEQAALAEELAPPAEVPVAETLEAPPKEALKAAPKAK